MLSTIADHDSPEDPGSSLLPHAEGTPSRRRHPVKDELDSFANKRATTGSLLRSVTILLAFWGLISLCSSVYQMIQNSIDVSEAATRHASQHPPCWCGTSNEEAVQLGCTYDHLAVDWLPPHCIDEGLVAEFDGAGPLTSGTWAYFVLDTSERAFVPIHADQIDTFARDGREYWTTRQWHVAHCLFTWRKQFRFARIEDKVLEPFNDHEEHVKHCVSFILDALQPFRSMDDIETRIAGESRHVGE